jgi:hypothetical protein
MTDPQSQEAIDTEEIQMNPSSPQPLPAEPFDDYDDGFDQALPVRTRAQYLTPLTALLMALILGGVGFYVGIRVEKSQTTGGAGGTSAFARAFTGATGGSSTTGSTSRTGALGSSASRFGAGFGGAAGAGAGTVGSVSSVDGNTIYVKETGGNTVKVKLSSATTISKSESVSKKKLYPGDEVVVSGSAGSSGTVLATSVTDSGASSTGTTGASSSSSSSSTGSASSQISSLFGGG